MSATTEPWDLLILDGRPPYGDLGSLAVGDVDGDGNLEMIIGSDGGLLWYRPATREKGQIAEGRFHVGLALKDFDGDGRPELLVGEHDPFKPYRHRCRLLGYKAADAAALSWWRWTLDDRFEHHDGVKVFELEAGRLGVASHGWKDVRYVHLWTAE